MPSNFEFAEVSYTLTDVIVAAYNKTAGTYSTVGSLASGHIVEVEFEADNDTLVGYGVNTALLSVIKGANLTFGAGGFDMSVMAIVSGWANSTSGTTPNQVRKTRLVAGGAGLPYFGLIGVAATDDGGAAVIGLRCCKLDAWPKWTMDGRENKFNVSETGGKAIPVTVSSALDIGTIKTYETASDFTAPTDASTFLAFFAAS